jgi:hypothetical protein
MERQDYRGYTLYSNSGLIPALVVIGVGVLFLLNNLNVFYLHDVWRFWPVILIAAGLAKLVDSPFEGGRNNGIVLIVVGGVFLVNTLGFIHLSWADFWPLALIGAGLLMLWQRLYTPSPVPPAAGAPGAPHEGFFNLYAVFGGVERKVTTDDFRGGHITAMFGGVDLNLRKAGIRGDSAVVDISAIFGGVDIKVPPNWLVIVDGASVFGGFSDKSAHPSPDTPGIKRLFIKGVAVLGGVSVKN